MKNIIHIESPKGERLTVELSENVFYIGGQIFLFTDMDDLLEIARDVLRDRKSPVFIIMKQCKDFEVASENSDAKCFIDTHEESKLLLSKKPNLCDICVYNKKHSKMNWEQWKNYEKEIDIEHK